MVPPIPTAGPTQTPSSMTLLPPTTNLPPIKSLLSPSSSHSLTVQTLSENLDYLRKIYNPSVRGSKRRRTVPSSSLHSSSSAGIASTNTTFSLDSFRSDTFERAYAIRWLGALIKAIDSGRLEDVLSTSITDNLVGKDTNIDLNLDSLLHSASALLAVCSGTSAAGRIVREYEFEVEVDITKTIAKRSMHVSLTDIPLSNSNGDSNSNTNTNSSDSNQTSSSSGTLVDAAPFASSLQLSPLSGSSPITSTSNHHRYHSMNQTNLNSTSNSYLPLPPSSPLPPSKSDYFASVGSQTWGGAVVLAEEIASRSGVFFPPWLTGRGVEGGFGNRDGFGDVDGEGGVSEGRDAREFNILELGAGTGLVSITAGKVAEVLLGVSTSTGMDTSVDSSDGCVVGVDENGHTVNIVATDYFPAVLDNLKENLERNFPSPSSSPSAPSSSISESSSPSSRPRLKSRVQVMAHPLDWSTFSTDSCTASCTTNTNTISFSSPPSVASTPSLHESSSSSPCTLPSASSTSSLNGSFSTGKFDLILGADIVYDTLHATWIKGVVERMLKRPNPNPKSKPERVLKVGYGLTPAPAPAFHLIIPLRKTFALESESVELVFRWALGSRDGDGKGVGRNCNCGEGAGAGAGLDVGVSDTKGDDTHNTQNRKDLESGLDPGKNLELVIYSKQIIVCDVEAGSGSGSSRGTGTGTGGEAGEAEAEEDGPESVEYAYYVIGWGVASSGPFLDMSSITSPAQSEG